MTWGNPLHGAAVASRVVAEVRKRSLKWRRAAVCVRKADGPGGPPTVGRAPVGRGPTGHGGTDPRDDTTTKKLGGRGNVVVPSNGNYFSQPILRNIDRNLKCELIAQNKLLMACTIPDSNLKSAETLPFIQNINP